MARDESDIIDAALPPDLEAIGAAIARLAAADREGAPAGLEERTAAATLPLLGGPIGREPVVRVIGRAAASRRWGMRLAAAVALTGTLAAVWLAQSPPARTAGADDGVLVAELDAWLAQPAVFEWTLTSLIEDASEDADALAESLWGDWSADEYLSLGESL